MALEVNTEINIVTEAKTSPAPAVDIAKWAVVVALIGAAAAVNIVFSGESLLYRVLGIVALGLVAAVVAFQTIKGALFAETLREARIEIRKVVWPTRQETLQTTALVLVVVFIAAIILYFLDLGLGWLASLVIG